MEGDDYISRARYMVDRKVEVGSLSDDERPGLFNVCIKISLIQKLIFTKQTKTVLNIF